MKFESEKNLEAENHQSLTKIKLSDFTKVPPTGDSLSTLESQCLLPLVMSSSVTTVDGMVVITQVIPREESIPLQDPAAAATHQAPPTAAKSSPNSTAKVEDWRAPYLLVQPHGLGVVQIFVGVLCVVFSFTATLSQMLILCTPFSLAFAFVMSGSLTVVAGSWTSVRLVWASLVSNVISVMVGGGGVAYLCWLLVDRPLTSVACDISVDQRNECVRKLWLLDVVGDGLLSLLLILLVLQISVAVTICIFSVKSIRCHDLCPPVPVKVDDCGSLFAGAVSEQLSDVALLENENKEMSRITSKHSMKEGGQ